ncbi:MAG: N-formylglutamate amidohydrolase [Rhodobacterales bacterium]|nr:N-formylglutamate amidohydrolase [Rhodobacterales bacterium]
MILHIPHASTRIPDTVRDQLLLNDEALKRELITMSDAYTDELFEAGPEDAVVRYPVSRLVLDPERFETGDPMEAKGMGLIYTRTADGRRLRHVPDANTRQALIERYYRPHHHTLETVVREALEHRGQAWIVDAHSFPDTPLPYEDDTLRPDLCIGTDMFHTPADLVDRLVTRCRELGWTVAINRPFAGSLVPLCFYQTDQRVRSIMFEINRKHYMNSHTGAKNTSYSECKRRVNALLNVIRSSEAHKH